MTPEERRNAARAVGIALVGNPNVGKSTLFNQLTGLGVTTAHYPGTTTEVSSGTTILGELEAVVADLPGTYSLTGPGDGPTLVRGELLGGRPGAVIAVCDETNLERNLYLVLQLLDFGLPVVVALNLHDEAVARGAAADAAALAEELGVAVVPTVATHGRGVAEVMELAAAIAEAAPETRRPVYGEALEGLLAPLTTAAAAVVDPPFGLSARAVAIALVEGMEEVEDPLASELAGQATLRLAASVRARLADAAGGAAAVVARERHELAREIAARTRGGERATRKGRDLWAVATSRVSGTLLLVAILGGVFGVLFFVGEALSTGFARLWEAAVAGPGAVLIERWLGTGIAADAATWGLAGVEASLAVGIPYILTFYVMLSVLEDSGYLNAAAFLADRTMHRFGLHGLAIVPLVGAAGCNVPAVLAAAALPSERERTIACTLVTFVPCSARTAVVLGSVGAFVGVLPALGVLAITVVVVVASGLILHRFIPGGSRGMVMEVFPFRRPTPAGVWRKAWGQFREFLTVAVPVVVVGSVILGVLYETGWLWRLTVVLDPVVVGWLGLPSVAGLTLLLGLLRKELALQLLVTLAVVAYGASVTSVTAFMTSSDVFVYALVNTLAIPCVSTLAVLGRKLGWKRAAAIAGATVGVALVLGGLFARVLPVLGVA